MSLCHLFLYSLTLVPLPREAEFTSTEKLRRWEAEDRRVRRFRVERLDPDLYPRSRYLVTLTEYDPGWDFKVAKEWPGYGATENEAADNALARHRAGPGNIRLVIPNPLP